VIRQGFSLIQTDGQIGITKIDRKQHISILPLPRHLQHADTCCTVA
jgi:hypothetical protein